MDDPQRDELAELRRRAYGRSPDITEDPGALARLHALEARSPGTRPVAPPHAPATPDVLLDGSTPEAADPAAPPPARVTRIALLWAASLLVTAVVTALVTAGATLWAGGSSDREVAILRLSDTGELPGWVNSGTADSLTSEDFYGLRVLKQPSGADGGSCISVLQASGEGDGAYSGVAYSGCTAGTYAATAQLTVSPALPTRLREAFSDGTGLRFVLEGETVHVRTGSR
ncbi:hypothetical protein SAMN06295885_0124 [Rathayibacter oskolensis]|uniref:Uncharacterized protein n=1 Tax=Rathayibacter oskolensis TaxID=1891671 RepID=A0A1X7MUE3_9MICO|nr:hypothetical protein [Rathayibacter oskolensis]SMH28274.1 hypothetical protein SAMN06295885_0124 [Rathayibacter oskolensis]